MYWVGGGPGPREGATMGVFGVGGGGTKKESYFDVEEKAPKNVDLH